MPPPEEVVVHLSTEPVSTTMLSPLDRSQSVGTAHTFPDTSRSAPGRRVARGPAKAGTLHLPAGSRVFQRPDRSHPLSRRSSRFR